MFRIYTVFQISSANAQLYLNELYMVYKVKYQNSAAVISRIHTFNLIIFYIYAFKIKIHALCNTAELYVLDLNCLNGVSVQ